MSNPTNSSHKSRHADAIDVEKSDCSVIFFPMARIPSKTPCRECGETPTITGLCRVHYRRMGRNGTPRLIRPAHWGEHKKHSSYMLWVKMKRSGRVAAWDLFEDFARDTGERPSMDHKFVRLDFSKPYGPDNFAWQPPLGHPDRAAFERQKHRSDAAKARWSPLGRAREHRAKLKRYGITPEQFLAMMDSQGGVCAICHGPSTAGRALSIDHCHETGVVRGLLCSHCNSGLGHFKDREDVMQSAVLYLQRGRVANVA